jgi:hypothetical protein
MLKVKRAVMIKFELRRNLNLSWSFAASLISLGGSLALPRRLPVACGLWAHTTGATPTHNHLLNLCNGYTLFVSGSLDFTFTFTGSVTLLQRTVMNSQRRLVSSISICMDDFRPL